MVLGICWRLSALPVGQLWNGYDDAGFLCTSKLQTQLAHAFQNNGRLNLVWTFTAKFVSKKKCVYGNIRRMGPALSITNIPLTFLSAPVWQGSSKLWNKTQDAERINGLLYHWAGFRTAAKIPTPLKHTHTHPHTLVPVFKRKGRKWESLVSFPSAVPLKAWRPHIEVGNALPHLSSFDQRFLQTLNTCPQFYHFNANNKNKKYVLPVFQLSCLIVF